MVTPEQAQAEISRLCDMIDGLDEEVFDKARSFFESVREGAVSMSQTIAEKKRVSEKQERAIRNWCSGVSRWLHDD